MDDFVGSPKPHAKRKLSAPQRSSQARQRMRIIREEAHTLPVSTPPSLGAGLRPSSLDRPGCVIFFRGTHNVRNNFGSIFNYIF